MGNLVRRVGRCRLDELRRPASFEALARAIVYQQLSGKAAATIYARFCNAIGSRRPNPAVILSTPHERLRRAGLSRRKASYVVDLATKVQSRRVSLRGLSSADDDEVVSRLTAVKGIGTWTAHMFLIFHLGRLDVLPVGDLGVRDSVRRAYGLDGLPSAKELQGIAAPWRPYRSAASWYLWRSRRPDELAASDP